MGNGINKVLPDLYLGNFRDARDREQLARNNITHILSIHDTAAPILQEMTYLCISAADLPTQNLTQHFKQSITFMHESRIKGEGCLVHCSEIGSKRSSRTALSRMKMMFRSCSPDLLKSTARRLKASNGPHRKPFLCSKCDVRLLPLPQSK
ncbi:dual specificity protein phosphatase 22-B isoform X5 [Nerophis ophidion]|uniref:dual specificity protein phosphatase 22-B isoform X5 n=1 Tax=Nerophis ophidion TaxID=159077 RepID=UPI002ADF3045|nr:dual specificity protein phosphatase 22-B isoform X5 [Nerophis ophidion]